MFGMETGIIHKGYIGYIKDSFLFASSMIINIYDFEKLDNPEKDVADTFTNHGMWDYDKCQVKCSGATEYILYKRIAQLELVAKNAELVTKKMCETISKLEKKCDAQQEMLLLPRSPLSNRLQEQTTSKVVNLRVSPVKDLIYMGNIMTALVPHMKPL